MSKIDPGFWVPVALTCVAAPVQATQYLSVDQAHRALFPEADAFTATPVRVTPELRARLRTESLGPIRGEELRAWAASRGGVLLGHVIVDDVIGKHELITYAVGIGIDGTLRNVEILDYRESRGGEVRDPRWRAQFKGKRRESPLRLEEDIQNISGATLSCRHITEGVRRLLALHAIVLRKP